MTGWWFIVKGTDIYKLEVVPNTEGGAILATLSKVENGAAMGSRDSDPIPTMRRVWTEPITGASEAELHAAAKARITKEGDAVVAVRKAT